MELSAEEPGAQVSRRMADGSTTMSVCVETVTCLVVDDTLYSLLNS